MRLSLILILIVVFLLFAVAYRDITISVNKKNICERKGGVYQGGICFKANTIFDLKEKP